LTLSRHIRLVGLLGLALCVAVGIAAGDSAAKKKKHKAASVFSASVSPNAAIPDEPPGDGHEIPVVSTITVGKKFKGKTVGDLNLTGFKTTGGSANAAGDLSISLSAPNGRTVFVEATALGGQSIGPMTFDDDTPTSICDSATLTCSDPDATLIRPFVGTANLLGLASGDTGQLSNFNGSPMRGAWTFRIWDNNNNSNTSTLDSWGLLLTAERPVK
jgi:hypothetical protein